MNTKEIKQSKSLTILTFVALLIVIAMMIFISILMITKNTTMLSTKTTGDMIGVWVVLTVAFSIFTWTFTSQLKEYMKLLYDVQKEKVFDEFANRLNDLIESKKLEMSVKETEEKLQNIGAI